jgi:hypothetical protein
MPWRPNKISLRRQKAGRYVIIDANPAGGQVARDIKGVFHKTNSSFDNELLRAAPEQFASSTRHDYLRINLKSFFSRLLSGSTLPV